MWKINQVKINLVIISVTVDPLCYLNNFEEIFSINKFGTLIMKDYSLELLNYFGIIC